jgi:hypothetical protein
VLGVRQLDIEAVPQWDIIAGASGSLADVGSWETASFEWQPVGGTLQSGDEFAVHVVRQLDAPADSFDVFRSVDIAPGRYWWTRGELHYATSQGRPVSVETAVSAGGFYDGHSTEYSTAATWRGGGHIILGADFSHTQARLASGRFTAIQSAARLEYAFTPRSDLLVFAQFNNEDRRADFDVRFHWIPVIGDDLFVVWNSGYSTDPASRWRFPAGRSLSRPMNGALVVKATHRFAL